MGNGKMQQQGSKWQEAAERDEQDEEGEKKSILATRERERQSRAEERGCGSDPSSGGRAQYGSLFVLLYEDTHFQYQMSSSRDRTACSTAE
eukprot:CAMPEP_0177666036 /NCGR_PEP_ID=MMETSP0447-20121125/21372_1 /TAXON_ID=0 /ORGANISM="Stygamoeba regulata, Strain BSH-02190019" /LENGTH=90 /DNA_ID=CAMNT_0019172167 /DNA_START=594 /DNA_END=866 /DNA_ORIENTATION=+